jgi:hypothetical protein
MRRADPLDTHGLDSLRQSQESGLHIHWKRCDFVIDDRPKGLNSPAHRLLFTKWLGGGHGT